MQFIRLVVFFIIGALVSGVLMFCYLSYILISNNTDPFSLKLTTLLFEIMGIQYHLLFGAIIGALVAPFPPKIDNLRHCVLVWSLVGFSVGLLTPFTVNVIRGHFPTVSELAAYFSFNWLFVLSGCSIGLILGLLQISYTHIKYSRELRRERELSYESLSKADDILSNFWSNRADEYLTKRKLQAKDSSSHRESGND
ncbi:MAG: hypothetical protein GY731_00205 [Gammaproteobacteria bacterium]|nr:hypothetical protein [Gammaproteobacteria bacterium]